MEIKKQNLELSKNRKNQLVPVISQKKLEIKFSSKDRIKVHRIALQDII